MSDRNSVWQTISQIVLSNPFWFGVAALLYRQPFRPWVGKALGRLRRPRLPSNHAAGLLVFAGPEPLPPGTASAVVMAMQPLPPSPHFVNNSHAMQWEAYQRHHGIAAHFTMQSTMPRFNPATLSAN
jgi:hypothetical protein